MNSIVPYLICSVFAGLSVFSGCLVSDMRKKLERERKMFMQLHEEKAVMENKSLRLYMQCIKEQTEVSEQLASCMRHVPDKKSCPEFFIRKEPSGKIHDGKRKKKILVK